MPPWIGVEFDGTLASDTGGKDATRVGRPIGEMVHRVKGWLREGKEVRIVSPRVRKLHGSLMLRVFCWEAFGRDLPITDRIDDEMAELWGSRCITVIPGTGQIPFGRATA